MEDYPYAEQVTDRIILSLGVLQVYDFRSHIPRSSASHKHEIFLSVLGQPKVSNHALEISLASHKDILRLQISMHDVTLMHGF